MLGVAWSGLREETALGTVTKEEPKLARCAGMQNSLQKPPEPQISEERHYELRCKEKQDRPRQDMVREIAEGAEAGSFSQFGKDTKGI